MAARHLTVEQWSFIDCCCRLLWLPLLLLASCGCCQLLVVSHQHQAIWLRSPRQSQRQCSHQVENCVRFSGVGVGGAACGGGGVDSHLLQLNLACLRGSTLCQPDWDSDRRRLWHILSLRTEFPSTDVPIWQLDNLFLKRSAPITQSALDDSNVSVVFLFSVIVLNQSQKSVIMTALLIVTAQSQSQL